MKILRPLSIFLIFNAAAFAVFLLSGQGAYLACAAAYGDLDCYLRKRNFAKMQEDKLTRSNIGAIDRNVRVSHGTQGRKSSEDFWTIRFKDKTTLPVAFGGISWPMGNLNFHSLQHLLQDRVTPPEVRELRLVSYGIIPWFFGFLLASIGWVLLLVGLAAPVQNVSADVLARNRWRNFMLLAGATAFMAALWYTIFKTLGNFFAG